MPVNTIATALGGGSSDDDCVINEWMWKQKLADALLGSRTQGAFLMPEHRVAHLHQIATSASLPPVKTKLSSDGGSELRCRSRFPIETQGRPGRIYDWGRAAL